MSMRWEKVCTAEPRHEFAGAVIYRGKVPGGWMMVMFWTSGNPGGPALCFYPDPDHVWDGSTLPNPNAMNEHAIHG